jgi:MFS superfamily sulfate permease-like transporter|tara:strand:+ start:964 stop:1257 length:294 start_codon:yes stop_codon:yes gene_type:complete
MFTAGLIAAAGLLFLLFKFNLRRIARFDIAIDVIATFFLMWIFAGTFAGMVAGLTAGLIISIVLFVAKRSMRTEKFGITKTDKFPYRKFGWKTVHPK